MQEISKDILSRAVDGDLDAFEQVYKATAGFVYSVALRFIRHRADAEEITQDVFLKIYKHLGSFRSQSSFKTWVYRITVNTAINYGKKKFRDQPCREDNDATINSQMVPPEAGNQLIQEEKEQSVQNLLATLNPDQRACLLLREIEGLDYQQIAQALQININTVRSRLKRARESLMTYAQKGVVQHEV